MQLLQRDRKIQEMKPYLNSEIIRVIDEVVHSARDRKVLRLRYVDGLTYEQIAEACELSPRYVAKIIHKHEMAVFNNLS